MGLARGQGKKREGRASLRGNPMTLGGPSTAGLTHGVRAVVFTAPVPSGRTVTMVRSKATASIFTRRICVCGHWAKTRSSTPRFDHRFMRV
jgi:acyl dehydratase